MKKQIGFLGVLVLAVLAVILLAFPVPVLAGSGDTNTVVSWERPDQSGRMIISNVVLAGSATVKGGASKDADVATNIVAVAPVVGFTPAFTTTNLTFIVDGAGKTGSVSLTYMSGITTQFGASATLQYGRLNVLGGIVTNAP